MLKHEEREPVNAYPSLPDPPASGVVNLYILICRYLRYSKYFTYYVKVRYKAKDIRYLPRYPL